MLSKSMNLKFVVISSIAFLGGVGSMYYLMFNWVKCYLPISASLKAYTKNMLYDFWMSMSFGVLAFVSVLVVFIVKTPTYYKSYLDDDQLEMFLTVVPLFLVFMFWIPSILKLKYLKMKGGGGVLELMGNQWFWEYDGDGQELEKKEFLFESDLVTSVVHFSVQSKDVMHSAGFRGLGTLDALPGRVKSVSMKVPHGVYSGNCMELCGIGHSHMPFSFMV